MASSPDHISMALFCDFENVALGVRDANYDKFDIKRVLERLLLKGSIVVKKAYCDWERYKGFKAAMHEANFELIEIPHVRQSGKNSADIRLVVDALDLCYTKSHVNTFVIISGDSDFSPLVSKLRENAKYVIGVGVKQSTSDLLIANCDEFIFYDDLVRESQRQAARRDNRDNREPQQARRTPEEEQRRRAELDARRSKAVEMAVETYEALVTDRDEGGKIWASVLKEAIKRRNPGFNENYYGFRTFGNLLEEAKARGLLEFGRDEKSSAFVFRSSGSALPLDSTDTTRPEPPVEREEVVAPEPIQANGERGAEAEASDERRRSRGGRRGSGRSGGRSGGHDERRNERRDEGPREPLATTSMEPAQPVATTTPPATSAVTTPEASASDSAEAPKARSTRARGERSTAKPRSGRTNKTDSAQATAPSPTVKAEVTPKPLDGDKAPAAEKATKKAASPRRKPAAKKASSKPQAGDTQAS
jgi:uncharacterized LabA/DUF88 family protein